MKYILPSLLVIPILEIFVLIEVGSLIGSMNTLFLIILTALFGLMLLRHQGLQTLTRARVKMQNAQLPSKEIITGFFLALGGALLLIPGFVTDFLGSLCLVPFTREFLLNILTKTFFDIPTPAEYKEPNKGFIEGEFKKEE